MGSTRIEEQELTEGADVIKNQDAIGIQRRKWEVRLCIHPFQTLTLAPKKLTFPEKLLHNGRKHQNWVITSYPLQGIFIYPVSLHLERVSGTRKLKLMQL